MAGCKVPPVPGDGTAMAGTGLQLLQQPEARAVEVGRTSSSIVLSQYPVTRHENVDVDLREVYFLVMHFLAKGPCTRAVGQLWNELLQHKLLPRRYHARYSREGHPSGDENDDGMSLPLSYRDVANRHPDITNDHLVALLRQLLVNNGRPAPALDSLSQAVTAADSPTLLGTGTFSLLDSERSGGQTVASRWERRLRWPHWHADQVHGLMLREIGGGFARHHRSPSVRTASFVVAKPSVFFSRIKIIRKLVGHRNAVYCAIFDRNGQHVITGSDDRLVKIWSTETGFCLRSCRGHEGDITDLAVSSNNNLVASASNDYSIRVWNLPNGFPVSVLRGHGGAVTAIKFSPRQGCEHHLLSSSDDGTCRIWDARDSGINSRVYMPDPKDPQNAARGVAVQGPPAPSAGNRIFCCAFNADGSIFVTGSSDKLARVWNATKWNDEHTGRPNYELDTLQGHENDVNYVQFSGCASPTRPSLAELLSKEEQLPRFKNTWSAHDSIVTCSRDGSAIIWTPRPRRHHAKAGRWVKAYHLKVPPPPMPPPRPGGPRQRMLPTPRGVNMVVWSLDNRFVLAAIMDCRICVWNAVDGSLVHSLTGHDKQTYVLDVHPFNPRIAMSAGYDGRVIIWDIWDGHPVRVYETGDLNLVDGNFSPDGSSLVVSDEVGQIYLFSTGEGNSQKDAKNDQFFLGDYRPLVRDTHGNVLDQESQLPPHMRNIQDLLCDIGMIPYAEPYQSLYQQRRLGALKFDWQPPAVLYQIGTLDDPPYAGPPEPPPLPPLPPPPPQPIPIVRSPDHRERRLVALDGGNRWVEQPNEAEEAVEWDQEVAGMTEDSGSDYSASEECEDDLDEKGNIFDDDDSDEDDDEDEDDEVRGDITIRLRRSSRNKRKTETVTYSSSGRRLKRKRYDDGDQGRRSARRRKGKRLRRDSPPRTRTPPRKAAASSRHSSRHQAETSSRPKRLAARNALHLLSSINDDEEEETVSHQTEKKVSDGEKVSGSGEPQRVLRSRHKEETDAPPLLVPHANRGEPSDRGEFSRRPRSQRKLVVKLRSSGPKLDLEDSKLEVSGELNGDAVPLDSALEDQVGPSGSNPGRERTHRKLVIKHPKPSGGQKRHANVIESSEEFVRDDGGGDETQSRRLGCNLDSDEDQEYTGGPKQQESSTWQWKKGKAAKRARGGHHLEDHSNDSGAANEGSGNDSQEWTDDREIPSRSCKLESHLSSDKKDSELQQQENWGGLKERGDELEKVPFSGGDVSTDFGGGQRPAELNGLLSTTRILDSDMVSNDSHEHRDLLLDVSEQRLESKVDSIGDGCLKGDANESSPVKNKSFELSTCQSDAVDTRIRNPEGLFGARDCATIVRVCSRDEGIRSVLRSGSVSESDDSAEAKEALEVRTKAHYSADEGNNSGRNVLKNLEKEESFPFDLGFANDLDDDNQMTEEEGGNIGLDEGMVESVPPTDSGDESGDNEGLIGDCGVESDELVDRETDEEIVEGKPRAKHTRQKTLRELQPYHRQESSSSRRGDAPDTLGKTRTRNLISVLNDGGRELRSRRAGKLRSVSADPVEIPERSTRKRTKEIQGPWQNGSGSRILRTRSGPYHDGQARLGGRDWRRGRLSQGSSLDPEQQGAVADNETRRSGRLEASSEDVVNKRQLTVKERRTSGRFRQEDGRRELSHERSRGKILAENGKDVRIRRIKPANRNRSDISWLLLTEVEAGTRYIPQYGDHVVYLRQGHEEFLKDEKFSRERGPWLNQKFVVRAVEFCTITHLEYSIRDDGRQTSCELTLKFTDPDSKVLGKSFRLSLPEVTNCPDFIVERTRYNYAMAKGWAPRDKCQVWWRSEGNEGQWWDGRIRSLTPRSPEFPDSPWNRIEVLYTKGSNDLDHHSAWELFEPDNHVHDRPHIDEERRRQLLSSIQVLVEKSCYVGDEDDFGLRRLTHDVKDPEYLNCIALPLDLDVVKERLEKDYYHSLEAFRHDVDLLVANTESFHGGDGEMIARVQRLGQFLHKAALYDDEHDSSDEKVYLSDEDRWDPDGG